MNFFKSTDGVRLAYQDTLTDGDTLILLTGYSGQQVEWQNQVEAFSQAGYRVITVDWRCHGQSARTSKNLRVSRLAADLRELIVNLELDDLTLIGHSMGASVIWAYLSLFGEARVAKLVSVDESPKLLNDATWSNGLYDLDWQNFPVLSETIMHHKMTVQPLASDFKQQLIKAKQAHPFNEGLAYPLLVNHLLQDWRGTLFDITVPQLFVVGGQSPLWPAGYHESIRPLLNDRSKIVIMPTSGHLPQLETETDFNGAILNFLTK